MKSKILIFTDHFLPGHRAGGPVSSMANLVKLLNDDFEIVIDTFIKDFNSDMIFLNRFFSHFSRVVLYLSLNKNFKTRVVLAPKREL